MGYPWHGLPSCQILASWAFPFSSYVEARDRRIDGETDGQTDRQTDRQRSIYNVPYRVGHNNKSVELNRAITDELKSKSVYSNFY